MGILAKVNCSICNYLFVTYLISFPIRETLLNWKSGCLLVTEESTLFLMFLSFFPFFIITFLCRAFTAVELRKKLCGKRFSAKTVDEVINDFKSRCISNDFWISLCFDFHQPVLLVLWTDVLSMNWCLFSPDKYINTYICGSTIKQTNRVIGRGSDAYNTSKCLGHSFHFFLSGTLKERGSFIIWTDITSFNPRFY